MIAAAAPPEVRTGHDRRGRFVPGNPGGPGNPFAGEVNRFRKRLLQKLTPEAMDAVIDNLLELATSGHWQAIKLVLTYVLGKPESVHDWAMTQCDINFDEALPAPQAKAAAPAPTPQPKQPSASAAAPSEPLPEIDLLGGQTMAEFLAGMGPPQEDLRDRVLNRPSPNGPQRKEGEQSPSPNGPRRKVDLLSPSTNGNLPGDASQIRVAAFDQPSSPPPTAAGSAK